MSLIIVNVSLGWVGSGAISGGWSGRLAGDAQQAAEEVERDSQPVGNDGVGAPGRRDFGDEGAAIANASAFDDDAGDDRPRRRTDPFLGLSQLVAGVQRDFELGQPEARAEAAAPIRSGATARRRSSRAR